MCLTVGRQSPDLRPLSRDPSVTFYKQFPNCLKRPKNVVRQSADGRVTFNNCCVTVQRLFLKFSQIAWNVQKTLFDSQPTVAWPPATVAWPFSDFFQKNFQLLETSKRRSPTVGRRSRDLRSLSRDRSATFYKKFLIAWNVQKRCLTVGRRSRDLRPLSRDHSANLFKNFPNCLKRPKNVVWQSTDGRVTSNHCRVTVQRLFSKNF